jgi:hypothetical protein
VQTGPTFNPKDFTDKLKQLQEEMKLKADKSEIFRLEADKAEKFYVEGEFKKTARELEQNRDWL